MKEKKFSEFLLRELLENVYQSAINQRIEGIKRNQMLIRYEILNDDVILTNLTKKKKHKDEIFKRIRMVTENHFIFYFDLKEQKRNYFNSKKKMVKYQHLKIKE